MSVPVLESLAGVLLVFVVPGFTLAKALFPERRVRGNDGGVWLVELVALSLFLSVVLTILLGFGLLVGSPAGFSASWSDPALEVALGATALLGLGVGWFRGAYRRVPPPAPALEPSPGSEDGWELLRQLEAAGRKERRIRHGLRRASSAAERATLETELAEAEREIRSLRERREGEYAQ